MRWIVDLPSVLLYQGFEKPSGSLLSPLFVIEPDVVHTVPHFISARPIKIVHEKVGEVTADPNGIVCYSCVEELIDWLIDSLIDSLSLTPFSILFKPYQDGHSSPTHVFSGFLTSVLHTTLFPSNWLLFELWIRTTDYMRNSCVINDL